MKDLPPDPHLLLSFINRGVPWPKVLAEFVDNAFDTAAGNAQHVRIELRKDRVVVIDEGRGIADVNRLGRLGASGSYHHEGNIGQYGVGAKTWMCKAKKLDVETIYDGRLHKHTFDLGPIVRALDKKDTPKRWLTQYDRAGARTTAPTRTVLTLRDFRPGAGPIFTPALVAELQRRYWPGLIAGRSITIEDYRKRPATTTEVQPLSPPNWSDHISFESEANGRRYRATLGILTDDVGAYGGLFIGFLFRNICVEKVLPTRAFPARVHGQIELSGDWRHQLSNYKDELIEDKEALLLDIETKAKSLFDLADEYVEDMRLEKIASEIQAVADDELRRALYGNYRSVNKRTFKSGTEPGEPVEQPGTKHETKPQKEDAPTAPKAQSESASGIRFGWGRFGHDVLGVVSRVDGVVEVKLNRDCPKLEAMSRQPKYPGLYLAIGNEIAMYCLELRPFEIEGVFGGMLGASEGTEDVRQMMNAIRVWWGFLAEEASQAKAA